MANKVLSFLRKNIFAVLMLVWLFLCFAPWTAWLESLPWVRMGMSIIIFSTPGIVASLILVGKRFSLISHFVSGVALSVFLVGLLGLLGRIFHLPFSYIKPVFVLIGLAAFVVLIWHSRSEQQLYKPKRYSITILVLFLAIAVLTVITSMISSFGGDDFSYLAYLTNWQHAQSLNFHEVIFGSGNLDVVRFWSAMFPMNLAFLAELSNLHGLLLLGLYLEPFLVVISLLSFYNLFEDLFPSGYLAIATLLLHFTFLFMLYTGRQPGSMFFFRISEDKTFAAFVLAPVFILAIRYLLEKITFRSVLFTLLCGWSLALTHPILVAYSVAIVGLYVCYLTFFVHRDYKRLAIVLVLLVLTILPSASLRFVGVPWVSRHIFGLSSPLNQPGAFDLETANDAVDAQTLISSIKDTPFYGFNLDRVQIQIPGQKVSTENPLQQFFSWSYLWILGLGFLWSLFNPRKNDVSALIGATALLVLLGAIPYTGWLLGYLVSARMLWRIPWMFSAGMAGVVLLNELVGFIFRRGQFSWKDRLSAETAASGLVFLISLVLISFFCVNFYAQRWPRLTTLDDRRNKLQALVDLGNSLESKLPKASIFVAPREISDYLPGISSKSKVVFFRTVLFTPHPVDTDKLNLIFSKNTSVSLKQRLNILTKYHIDDILVNDASLKDYYAGYPELFHVQEVPNFWILEFQKPKP